MKQKLLTLLLLIISLYVVIPQTGGDLIDDKETSSAVADSVDSDCYSDSFDSIV